MTIHVVSVTTSLPITHSRKERHNVEDPIANDICPDASASSSSSLQAPLREAFSEIQTDKKEEKQIKSVGGRWNVNKLGVVLYKGHKSYGLMVSVQLGIRTMVGVITPRPFRELTIDDFQIEIKTKFPSKGSDRTPPHTEKDFQFKDYCPLVYRHLRERFGIDAAHYMVSLCGDESLSMLGTPGKSGALFFFSADMQYIIKTITKKEAKFLREIIPSYYQHVMRYPNTLVTRFFGMHRIKPANGNNVRFVVMNNVFDTRLKINDRYDLKGSTVGRYASEREKQKKDPCLKDLDINKHIMVGADRKEILINQLKADCAWLAAAKIMDYSLLLGIHNSEGSAEDFELDAAAADLGELVKHETSPSNTSTSSASSAHTNVGSLASTAGSNENTAKNGAGAPSAAFRFTGKNTRRNAFQTFYGGMLWSPNDGDGTQQQQQQPQPPQASTSTTPNNLANLIDVNASNVTAVTDGLLRQQQQQQQQQNEKTEIYFLGIIDILQKWDGKKQAERFFKSFKYDKAGISAADPDAYARRFQTFMQALFE